MGYLLTIITTLSANLMAGTAIHGVFSLGGIFFLGLPAVCKLAAYTLAIAQRAGLTPEWSFLLAIATAALAGVIFSLLFVRLSPDSFAVLGLAALLAMEALLKSWNEMTNGVLGIAGIERPDLLASLPAMAAAYLIFALLLLTVHYLILHSAPGRLIRAYRQNETALQSMGVRTRRLGGKMVLLSSVILSLTAILFTWRIQFIDPAILGLPFLIEIVTIGILALAPQLRAVAGSALLVTFLPEIMRLFALPATIMGNARLLIYCLVLLFLLKKLAFKTNLTRTV
jgi:branched-chain amino acid transport system permease protein